MAALARSTGLDGVAAGDAVSVPSTSLGSSLRRSNQMPPAAAASINSMAAMIRMLLKGLSFSGGSVAVSLILGEALPRVRGAGCCASGGGVGLSTGTCLLAAMGVSSGEVSVLGGRLALTLGAAIAVRALCGFSG